MYFIIKLVTFLFIMICEANCSFHGNISYTLHVTCNAHLMTSSIQPQPTLGVLHVEGDYTSQGCAAGADENFTLTLAYGSNICGLSVFSPTKDIVFLFRRISPTIHSQYDGRYLVRCMNLYKGDAFVQTESGTENLAPLADSSSVEELEEMLRGENFDMKVANYLDMVTEPPMIMEKGFMEARPNITAPSLLITFYNGDGEKISFANFNDEVTMMLEVLGEMKTMYAIKPRSCKATDGQRTESTALYLYKNTCPNPTYKDLLSLKPFTRPENLGNYASQGSFRAFTFVTSEDGSVIFHCAVLVCESNDTDCSLPTCSDRRKRSLSTIVRKERFATKDVANSAHNMYSLDVAAVLFVRPPKSVKATNATNKEVHVGKDSRADVHLEKSDLYRFILIFSSICALSINIIMIFIVCYRKFHRKTGTQQNDPSPIKKGAHTDVEKNDIKHEEHI